MQYHAFPCNAMQYHVGTLQEEMEALFRALKEVAAGRAPAQYDEVEALIGDMKRLSEPSLHHRAELRAMKQRLGSGGGSAPLRSSGQLGASRRLCSEWLQDM
jgi:hypothetical protein